ncbi:MAG TPA: 2-succinyl-5-enolpyruvyl-6-hydroxy-3-cyclohexene-1-carboxylic-acid synthase, partial [Acidimicrobiia bacterium]|nr:2-succinyl-5-enolpyruvyl-6-hydroxy-3-cyclohexene-1-carboxylic-acid synthase [Acidimicrobiia bacterium]
AAANFYPAVLEAHHARVPLIVCTADRPPELRDVGAGQTVDQLKLYGDAVRWFHDAGVPDDHPGAGAEWRSLAARAVADALGPAAGPVHLNLPFREPLVPTGAPPVDAPGRSDGRPWVARAAGPRAPSEEMLDALDAFVRRTRRGLVVAGWGADVEPAALLEFAEATGWPVLADPVSGLRAPGTVSTYDALLRVPEFAGAHRPDGVVRLGATPTNKTTTQWLDPDVGQVLVDPDGAWPDPQHAVSARLVVDAGALLAALMPRLRDVTVDDEWSRSWSEADANARAAIDDLVDGWDEPFEGRIARDVLAAVPDGGSLLVASSMPVRDVESFAAPRTGIRVLANRGVNGIDGFVSTTLGVAAASGAPTVALLGDLCFLHDSNGLLGAAGRGVDTTFVVIDNDGGGIFSFLPQAELPDHFETLFGTPHGVDIAALAGIHGLPVVQIDRGADVAKAVAGATSDGGVQVIVVRTDRASNVARHREVWAAVARRLRS